MDSTSTVHAYLQTPSRIPAACPQQGGMGGIKGIRDVKGLILLANRLSY